MPGRKKKSIYCRRCCTEHSEEHVEQHFPSQLGGNFKKQTVRTAMPACTVDVERELLASITSLITETRPWSRTRLAMAHSIAWPELRVRCQEANARGLVLEGGTLAAMEAR